MSPTSPADAKERTFRAFYAEVHPDLECFVRRRAAPELVDAVLADTFLLVWRRLDEVPTQTEDARAWTFAVARHVLLTQRRTDDRRAALGVRLAAATPTEPVVGDEADAVASRIDVERAWGLLSEVHQEALGLAVFEGMNAVRAAAVLEISPVAYRLRLSRARRALRLHLDHQPHRSRSRTGAPERSIP